MECPHCAETLRLIDRSPAPPGSFIRMTCPARPCGREIVARVREDHLEPLTRAAVRGHAMRVVFVALRADFTFPIIGALGTVVCTAFLALWQFVNPSEHGDNLRGILAIVLGGMSIVLVFGMSVVVDFALGVRGWRNALPRPMLDVKTMPTSYRT